MKITKIAIYSSLLVALFIPFSAFSMMEVESSPTPESRRNIGPLISLDEEVLNILAPQRKREEDSPLEQQLATLGGKNLSGYPLSEEMLKFIVKKVGPDNTRKFVFKAGPQIIFEDEV